MKRREKGSIEARVQGKKYLIRWTAKDATGKSIRKNKIVKGDFIEAQSELARKVRPAEEGPIPVERAFADFADNQWAHYTSEHWRGSTLVVQGNYATKHIRPYFDAMILKEIKPEDIVNFHIALAAKGLSRKTRRNIHMLLVTMFNYAADALEIIPKSPVKKGHAPKVEKREKPSLTQEQAWSLWDILKDEMLIRYRAFYGVLLFTGIRTGEALGLKWADLDFAGHQLEVKRAWVRAKGGRHEGPPKTEHSLRKRPILPELYAALLHHKAMAHYTKPADYVFACSTGNPLNCDTLRETLQGVLRDKLKITLGPHEDGLHLLRHTSGSLVYRATCNVKETQKWLGHGSATVTLDTYTHLMKESQQQTAEQVFTRPAVLAPSGNA